MENEKPHSKCCAQTTFHDRPTAAWDVEKLGAYAQAQNHEIEVDEQSLTHAYWRLGLALNLARRQFAHGQWTRFLAELGIDKGRASKARAIQRSFETENLVDGLSVREAYRRRKPCIRKPSTKKRRRKATCKNQRVNIADWLIDVCKQIDFFLNEVESDQSDDVANALPVLQTALDEMVRLQRQIQQRIGTHR